MTGVRDSADERGISTVVSHVMSVGITTLLIISLVATATGFLDEQKERAADGELQAIGHQLADELAAADRLARNGDDVRITSTMPERVAGSTYTVTLLHDSAVGAGSCGAFPTTRTCLRVQADAYDQSALVAVYNETELELISGASGRFVITSDVGSNPTQIDRRRIELTPRVGIGSTVTSESSFSGGRFTRPPIARFGLTPAVPQTNKQVKFDASASTDSNGNIATYQWDFNNDSTIDATGVTATHSFPSPGSWNVTLTVIDNDGLSDSFTREIDVSGLEYNDDIAVVGPDSRTVTFTVTNRYTSEVIDIERVMIDPANPGYTELDEFGEEVEVDGPIGGTLEGFTDWSGSAIIREDGLIVDIDADGSNNGNDVTLAPGESARITFGELGPTSTPIPNDETFTFGVRYRIGSNVSANVFTVSTPP